MQSQHIYDGHLVTVQTFSDTPVTKVYVDPAYSIIRLLHVMPEGDSWKVTWGKDENCKDYFNTRFDCFEQAVLAARHAIIHEMRKKDNLPNTKLMEQRKEFFRDN